MRHSRLSLLFAFPLSLTLLAGCGGSKSGPAEPATDMDEIQQFLADNPDQNADNLDEDMDEDVEDDATQ